MLFRQFSDAYDCYKELLVALDFAKINREKKLMLYNETKRAMEHLCIICMGTSIYNDPNVSIYPPPDLPKISVINPKYPAVSDAIDFK